MASNDSLQVMHSASFIVKLTGVSVPEVLLELLGWVKFARPEALNKRKMASFGILTELVFPLSRSPSGK